MTEPLLRRLRDATVVLFDGTLWTDDEMIRAGLGSKTGQRMGHLSMDGPDGTIAALREIHSQRRIFIHINNSNPALIENSKERSIAESAGWEIGYDGMEIEL
jgi:pyrroloquinoline quinone biosynthesis protein B